MVASRYTLVQVRRWGNPCSRREGLRCRNLGSVPDGCLLTTLWSVLGGLFADDADGFVDVSFVLVTDIVLLLDDV